MANPVNLDDPSQLLGALRDIHLPEPVSAWPLSPLAWFVLLVLTTLLCIVATLLTRRLQRHRRNKDPVFQALHQLDNSYAEWKRSGSAAQYLEQSGVILKRLALQFAGRQQTARLTGQPWVRWLNDNSNMAIPASAVSALQDQRYSRHPVADIAELHSTLTQWIRQCRRNLRA